MICTSGLYNQPHINITAVMGICNNKTKEKQIAFSTKAILQPQKFQKMSFYFSTETLLRLDADCLIVYCDEKINLNKNGHLLQAGKFQTRKIKQYAQAYLLAEKIKLVAGQTILFPISIPTLRFKNVCLVCLKIWDGREKIGANLQRAISSMFKLIEKSNIKSIAFTELNQQFGIPTQLGCKVVVQALQDCKEWLRIVTFICNDVSTQGYYMEKINYNQEGKTELSKNGGSEKERRWSNTLSGESNYY